MRHRHILVPALLSLALAGGAGAQVIAPQPLPADAPAARKGDPAQGRIIAERWCAECHLVSAQQKAGKADVPPFSAVAKKGLRDAELQQFLMSPHPRMPDMQIGRQEAADLVAYIESQKP